MICSQKVNCYMEQKQKLYKIQTYKQDVQNMQDIDINRVIIISS